MDKEKNGVLTKDRAFANVYILNIHDKEYNYNFTDGEVMGVAKMKASLILDLFEDKINSFKGTIIRPNETYEKEITKEDFLVMKHETLEEKYGYILEAIKNKSSN